MRMLRRLDIEDVWRRNHVAVPTAIRATASAIVADVRLRGEEAVREYAQQFGEREQTQPLILGPEEMSNALEAMDASDRAALQRTAERIRRFAEAQRGAINDVTVPVPGGQAGHTVVPVDAAGCYAPAGRYPLVSSVLMTAVTARAAGCRRVVVASPGAHRGILAAAGIAGADGVLAVGGAHAIGALAYGIDGLERCDVIVGPGNHWVTAAKHIVSADVGIDMLAGPSELLVLADDQADARVIATDLLAQAEHDVAASAMLVTTSESLADAVDAEIETQLDSLTSRDVASKALANGFTSVVRTREDLLAAADRIAAEHLEIHTKDAADLARRVRHAGAIFIGEHSAEVLGDFGVGPNHTLPTGGTARFSAGLSVMHFLRLRTWLHMQEPEEALLDDTCRLAAMEALPGHRRAAEIRRR